MNNYLQPGNVVTLTAPAGGVTSGNGYQIGQLFVVAANTAAEGAEFEGQTCGVFTLPKTSAQAWTEGALVYWDTAQDEVTTVVAGNLLIGIAAAAAANPSSTGEVRLNGIARNDSVLTADIADDAVTAAKAPVFVSSEQTGTGASQNVAHGLGATPTLVLIAVTEDPAGTGFDVAEGTHTSTNVVVTVTSGVKYKVLAWA